jgi:hypothetical protein
LGSTGAGACLTTERFASQAPSGLNVLCTDQPYRAFVKIMRLLFRDALRPSSPFESAAIDSTAIIHPSAEVGSEVTVDPRFSHWPTRIHRGRHGARRHDRHRRQRTYRPQLLNRIQYNDYSRYYR